MVDSIRILADLPRDTFEFGDDGYVKPGPLEHGGYAFQSHLPILPGDMGPLGFPLAYLSDGTLVEWFDWQYPLIVRRGDEEIERFRKKYADI